MTMDDAAAAIQKRLPGMGGWAEWSKLDPSEAQVGYMEHRKEGPADRVVLGRSRHGFDNALQAALEKVASWDDPKPARAVKQKVDPNALPQENMDL